MRQRSAKRFGKFVEDADVRELPELFAVIESVAHNETVFDFEAGVVDGRGDRTPRRLG